MVAKKRNTYTDEQKNDMVKRVDSLRSNKGMTIKQACESASVNMSVYTWWKGRLEGKSYADRSSAKMKAKRQASTNMRGLEGPIKLAIDSMSSATPEPKQAYVAPFDNDQLVVLIGKPEDVRASLETLARIRGASKSRE